MKGNCKEQELKDTDKGVVTGGKGEMEVEEGTGGQMVMGRKKQLQSNDPEGICPKESQVRVRVREGALAT